jgi:hypothetical protein
MEVNRISLPLFCSTLPNQINLIPLVHFASYQMNNPSTVNLLGINRDNHTLTAKFLCQIIDQLWVFLPKELIETYHPF